MLDVWRKKKKKKESIWKCCQRSEMKGIFFFRARRKQRWSRCITNGVKRKLWHLNCWINLPTPTKWNSHLSYYIGIIFLLFPIYLVHAYFFSNSNLKLSHWYKTLVNVSIWAVYLLCFICVLKKKSTPHLFQNGLNSHFASDVTFTWSVISKFILWHVSL